MSSFALLCTDDCNVVLLNAGRYTAVAGPWNNVVNRKTEKINNDGGMMMCHNIIGVSIRRLRSKVLVTVSYFYCYIKVCTYPMDFFCVCLGPIKSLTSGTRG